MHKRHKLFFSLLVVIHLLLIVLALSGRLNFLFNDAALRKGKGADFFAVYQAGYNAVRGDSVYLDNEGVATPYSYPFRYLPVMGYGVGAAFNVLKPFTGYYVWVAICEILLGVNLFITYKLAKNFSLFIIASIPWLIFTPYLLEIYMGQWTFLAASLLFYSICGLICKSKSIYSYILGVLAKPNSLLLLPIFLRPKKFKLILFTTLAVLLTSVPYFLIFKSDLQVFLLNFKDVIWSHGGNLGLKSFFYLFSVKYFSIPYPRVFFDLFVLPLGVITLYYTFKFKNIILSFALWTCFYFLIYKDVWEHHYVLLMPVFALIVIKFKLTFKQLLSRKYLPILLSFILIALPTLFCLQYLFVKGAPVEPDNLSFWFTIPYHATKILGVVILYIWAIVAMKKLGGRTTVSGAEV